MHHPTQQKRKSRRAQKGSNAGHTWHGPQEARRRDGRDVGAACSVQRRTSERNDVSTNRTEETAMGWETAQSNRSQPFAEASSRALTQRPASTTNARRRLQQGADSQAARSNNRGRSKQIPVLLPWLAQALPAARLYCEYCCRQRTHHMPDHIEAGQQHGHPEARRSSHMHGELRRTGSGIHAPRRTETQRPSASFNEERLTFVMCVLPRGLPSTLT